MLSEKGNDVTDKGAVAFAEMLQVNNSLKTLDLSFNKISDEGVIAIGKG